MSKRSTVSLFILAITSLFILTGFGCRRPDSAQSLDQPLVMWGLWQESADMASVVEAFEEQTGVEVEYKKLGSVANYERELLEGLAQGRGPDIFVIHHTWVEDKRGIMSPAPPEVIDEKTLNDEFVEVAGKDLVRDGLVYALPTSIDNLALYVNRDILNAAGVARPPSTWQEFQQATDRITEVSRTGVIQQSAGAIGTAGNVNRAPDILQLLMLQSGISIIDEEGEIDIDNEIGRRALTFYTDFANKSKRVYTWNLQQDYSIDAFAEGNTAMMVNYSYHIPTVKAKNPRLNFSIAPIPQIADSGTPQTFASYWPFAVSNTSRAPLAAWQFLRFLTSNAESAIVNQAQGTPPARRDSIEQFSRDPFLGTFAEQTLIANSWPRVDIVAADAIFNRMIDDLVTGNTTVEEAIGQAEDQLNTLNGSN